MNTDTGRGSWVFVTVRTQGGEELPFMVDTGTPVIILDKSLEPQLGDRLSEGEFSLEGVERESGEYSAPKLYLGGAPLLTGTNVFTYDLQRLMARALHPHPILGILGMDCLRHYCLQLDFQAGKMRFLDCPSRPASALGKAYPLILRPAPGNLPSAGALTVFIHHLGLAGGKNTNACLDTGMRTDGVVEKGLVQGHYLQRFRHLLGPSRTKFRLAVCVWDDQTYTRVCVDEGRNGNTLGLAFLARHLVTFDFPRQVFISNRRASARSVPKPINESHAIQPACRRRRRDGASARFWESVARRASALSLYEALQRPATQVRNEDERRSTTAKYAEHAEGGAERRRFFSAYSAYFAVATQRLSGLA